jgi:hypothetical protein
MTDTPTEDHEHVWQFLYTVEDWWDGDETDVYECAMEGCGATNREYIPR